MNKPVPHRNAMRSPPGAPHTEMPTVGVIYNPRSHRNKGQDLASDPAPHVFVAQPGDRSQLPVALQRFRDRGINLLVINGGDGTVRDALTAGWQIFGEDWPAVAVLPKGKTNALTVDLDAPGDWSLQDAIDAYRRGRRITRQPLAVTADPSADGTAGGASDGASGGDATAMLGFILGAGAFSLGISKGQDAHRLGAFNSLAVGVTAVWGVLTALAGGADNPWRRGARMDIRIVPPGGGMPVPLARSTLGDPDYRQLLLASTLERFPAGMKPFGHVEGGLKIAVIDHASRRTLLRLPLTLRGNLPQDMAAKGLHQCAADCLSLDIAEPIILDGEAYPAGKYRIEPGPAIDFVAP